MKRLPLLAIGDVADSFESPALSPIWSTDRFEKGAVQPASTIVRAGHGAVRITVRSRDKFEAGRNGSKDTERAELSEQSRLDSPEDAAYE